MPINVTISAQDYHNLNHLYNISIEFCGEPEIIDNNLLNVYFPNNYNAMMYKKVLEPYFSGVALV